MKKLNWLYLFILTILSVKDVTGQSQINFDLKFGHSINETKFLLLNNVEGGLGFGGIYKSSKDNLFSPNFEIGILPQFDLSKNMKFGIGINYTSLFQRQILNLGIYNIANRDLPLEIEVSNLKKIIGISNIPLILTLNLSKLNFQIGYQFGIKINEFENSTKTNFNSLGVPISDTEPQTTTYLENYNNELLFSMGYNINTKFIYNLNFALRSKALSKNYRNYNFDYPKFRISTGITYVLKTKEDK